MSEEKFYCERCGKELVFRCAYSKIDHKLIYVDELPKNCIDCPCESESYCNLLNIGIDIREHIVTPNCPLKLITDRLAEERQKVVQEIRERLTKYTLTNDDFLFDTYYKAVDVEKVLDQIERGV